MTWPWSRTPAVAPPDVKQNPVGRVIVLNLRPEAPETIRHTNFDRLAKETFEGSAIVYACVTAIAKACAPVPWVLMQTARAGKAKRLMTSMTMRKARSSAQDARRFPTLTKTLDQTEVVDHDLLRLIARPNPTQPQSDYLEQLIGCWLVSGNAYEKMVSTTLSRGKPKELWGLRPDRVEVMPEKSPEGAEERGIVKGYRYKVRPSDQGKAVEDFSVKDVIHHKMVSLTDDWYGLSPLQAAARDWRITTTGQDWNAAIIKNGARPSGALVVPTLLQTDDRKALKEELTEGYAGQANQGRPLLLEGGMKWEQMMLSPMELDFLNSMQKAEIRVCWVYGVPPELIAADRSTAYNRDLRSEFWQEANLPLLEKLRDSYNARLTPLFGDDLYLDFDRDQIEAIQEDRTKTWQRLSTASFLSTNEKRVAAGYDTVADPMADTPAFLLNPTPGATGILPAGSSDTATKSLDEILDGLSLTADERHAVRQALDEKTRRLTQEQRVIQEKMRRTMQRFYREQGTALAAYLRRELGKLETRT